MEAAQLLKDSGIDHSMREAEWLLEAVTGKSSWELKTFRQPIDDALVDRLAELIKRRQSGEPLQYITGVAGFRGIELTVGPGVFIPRPETEITAGIAMDHLPEEGLLLEVGTGSGAIALAIAAERPDARIVATEISLEAFAYAQRNAEILMSEVTLLQGDLFEPLDDSMLASFDVIVSNPPYIANREANRLPPEVVEHEPHQALFAGDDGLIIIRRIAEEAHRWLRPDAWLVLEMSEFHGEAVPAVLRRSGYQDVTIDRDLAGRDRVAAGRWTGGGS